MRLGLKEFGALAYVTKPFHPPALLSLVAGALAWPRKRTQVAEAPPRQSCVRSPRHLS